MTTPNDIEILRKRLSWRAHHRGIKEMDLVFGGYADLHLTQMGQAELLVFEQLLELPDQDVLSWMTKQSEIPPQTDCPMLQDILKFRPVNHHD